MMASEFEAYRGLFVAESRENHENLVKNLLILEKGPDQNAIDEIFRSVHTLKGASASMGYAEMERLCHAMEDVFQLVRSGSAEVSEELENLLLACSDVLEQMIDDVEGGGDSSSLNADDKVAELKGWLGQKGKKSPASEKASSKSPAKVPAQDIVEEEPSTGSLPEYEWSSPLPRNAQ
jgi:two-component system, chemotaxis family, sensor kinase CheA